MPPASPSPARRRLGLALLVLGLAAILWGVVHVLAASQGARTLRTRFEERRTYDQVKPDVQRALPGALLRALPGLGLALLGARLRRD